MVAEREAWRTGPEDHVLLGELGDAALHYAHYGIPIFPVWNPTENGGCACSRDLGCPSPAEHPVGFLVPRGLQDATKDPERVKEWWTLYPEANIGKPTGAWSGAVVLDVDPEKGGFESLLALVRRHDTLPWARLVHTGGDGLHLYFEHNGKYTRKSGGKLGPGLKLLGDGGSVLLPPSVYVKSRTYAWHRSLG